MGKNLLIAHGGGPTAVINCSLYGAVTAACESAEVDKVLAARHGIQGVLDGDLLDLGRESRETIAGLTATPASAIGSCRRKIDEEDPCRILKILQKYDVRYFLYTGGNDSMDTALKVHRCAQAMGADLKVAGIPKTIDNDLACTDHAPGFPSAARYFGSLFRDLGCDIRSLPTPVSVCEVLGRNAGWLAAASVAARECEDDAPHLIYVPERPVSKAVFLTQVAEVVERYGWAVVAVSEGARDETGKVIAEAASGAAADGFGHALPGGVAAAMARWIVEELGIRARSEKPGIPGRASILLRSGVDVQEAITLGRAAVEHVVAGESGHMMALERVSGDPCRYESKVKPVPLDRVVNVERLLPEEYLAGTGQIASSYLDYLRPLLGGPWPEYVRLTGYQV